MVRSGEALVRTYRAYRLLATGGWLAAAAVFLALFAAVAYAAVRHPSPPNLALAAIEAAAWLLFAAGCLRRARVGGAGARGDR